MRTPTRRRVRRLRDNPEGQMTILEHLTELRDRLLRCVLALFIITTTVAFVVVYEPVLRFVTKSYCTIPAKYRVATAGGGCRLLALSPPGPDRHPHPGRPHGRAAAGNALPGLPALAVHHPGPQAQREALRGPFSAGRHERSRLVPDRRLLRAADGLRVR